MLNILNPVKKLVQDLSRLFMFKKPFSYNLTPFLSRVCGRLSAEGSEFSMASVELLAKLLIRG